MLESINSQSIPAAVFQALPALPDQPHIINIKMPKQHPIADVITAVARFTLYAVAGAITFMYAKSKIETGSPLSPSKLPSMSLKR